MRGTTHVVNIECVPSMLDRVNAGDFSGWTSYWRGALDGTEKQNFMVVVMRGKKITIKYAYDIGRRDKILYFRDPEDAYRQRIVAQLKAAKE